VQQRLVKLTPRGTSLTRDESEAERGLASGDQAWDVRYKRVWKYKRAMKDEGKT
jgi:hypothetical protein